MTRTCLTIRIDVPTPLHEASVKNHFQDNYSFLYDSICYADSSYVIYLEKKPKRHYHIRLVSNLTRQAIHTRLKKLYDELELKPSQHSHHVVWQTIKGEKRTCKKHTNCVMGSFTYIAKHCTLISKFNLSVEKIQEIEKVGKQRLIESKLPVHEKIALIYDLDEFATEQSIFFAFRQYFIDAKKAPPYNSKILLHKLMCHIGYNKYKNYYYRKLLEQIQLDNPGFF